MNGRGYVCTERLIRKRPLTPLPHPPSFPSSFLTITLLAFCFISLLARTLSIFTDLLLSLMSLLSYLFSLLTPPFVPFKMTRNVHTLHHPSGAVVARQHCFLLPKQKKKTKSMIYSIKRERDRERYRETMIKCEITRGHLFGCLSLLCCHHHTVCKEDSISSPMQRWNLLAATVCVGWQVTVGTMYLSVNSKNNRQQPEN